MKSVRHEGAEVGGIEAKIRPTSRRLGPTQRAILLALARIEVAAAEAAAVRRKPYWPPTYVKTAQLLNEILTHELDDATDRLTAQRRRYAAAILAGNSDTLGQLLLQAGSDRDRLDPLYNHSRGLRALQRRGLIAARYPRFSRPFARGVALTPTGLALACRLGGIGSEIVDLERLIDDTDEIWGRPFR